MTAIRVAVVARDGRLLPHALASKLHAENALELAQNLLIRNRLTGFILLHDLRLLVDLLRQLRLRELLRQPSLQDGLLHVGAHRLVRQVFIVEFEFQRVSSRPGVFSVRAIPSVDLFSPSRRVASRRVRVASASEFAYPFSPCPPRCPRATPASCAPRSPRSSVSPLGRARRRFSSTARVASSVVASSRRVPSSSVPSSRARHSCIHSFVPRASLASRSSSRAHRGDRLGILHRLRARPRPLRRRALPDRDLLPILMRHDARFTRRRLARCAARRASRSLGRDPDRSIVRFRNRSIDRSISSRSRSIDRVHRGR